METPRRRKDGKCVVCRKLITVTPRAGLNPFVYERDPFCSAVCSRKYFGTKNLLTRNPS